jgi:hypothetical protein
MKKDLKYKICQSCNKECSLETVTCTCGSLKFAPEYIKKIAKLSRYFSVQVTEVGEQYRTPNKPDKRVTLYKWWPGNKSSININTKEEWDKIRNIIDNDLGPYLGWKTKKEILQTISETKDIAKSVDDLSKNYPDFVNKLIQGINFDKVSEDELPKVQAAINSLLSALENADASFVAATKRIIDELPKQGKRAIEDLADLLKQWTLRQITAISSEVKHRIETINIFEKAILDDKTYEIRGDGSVHRILENAMWIIDERYWLLHSNQTLRTIVGDKILEKNKKLKSKRPDFVCGTIGNKTILVELKRPAHELTSSDYEQLETYMMIIEEHSGKSQNFEGYLIGKKVSDDLQKRMRLRGSNLIKVKTFSDLIDDVRSRYTQYLKQLK